MASESRHAPAALRSRPSSRRGSSAAPRPSAASAEKTSLSPSPPPPARTFLLRLTQHSPQTRYSDTESRSAAGAVPPGGEASLACAVRGGGTVEATVSQFWSSHGSGAVEVEAGDKRFSKAPSAAVAPPPAAAFDAAEDFVPCSDFAGPRPGWFFGTRRGTGTGYYRDGGGGKKGFSSPSSASRRSLAPPTPGRAAAAGGGEEGEQEAPIPSLSLGGVDRGGWVAMRTVAELRRAAQLSAPRDPDSLYRPVERAAVRRFNPLRVPRALQAALPFASKQKAAAPRKRKDLDSRRAVALDAEGKRAASLVAQLNAIRNSKAAKKLLKQATKRAAHSKKVQEIEASKGIRRKEERKRKFVEEGRKERAAAKKSRGGGARD